MFFTSSYFQRSDDPVKPRRIDPVKPAPIDFVKPGPIDLKPIPVFTIIIPTGKKSTTYFNVASYYVRCITYIPLTCDSSGNLSEPNAVIFTNETNNAIDLTYNSNIKISINPGASSSVLTDVTSYSLQCIPITNISINCSSSGILSLPNAITFTNAESIKPITVTTSATTLIVAPDAITTIVRDISNYTVSCPDLLVISSCNEPQPDIPSGLFIVQNTSPSVILITVFILNPKGISGKETLSFILNPEEISRLYGSWSSYTVSCPPTKTQDVVCDSSGTLVSTNILNFRNTTKNMMAITVNNNDTIDFNPVGRAGLPTFSNAYTFAVPANSLTPYVTGVTSYACACPPPETIVMTCGGTSVTTIPTPNLIQFQNTNEYTMYVNGISVAANSVSDYFANLSSYNISC